MRKSVLTGTIVVTVFLVASVFVVTPYLRQKPMPETTALRQQVEELGNLVTAEFEYRDVVHFGEETRLLGIRTGTQEILFSVHIIVTAGIDLTAGVELDRVDRRTREIFITVPEPVILRVSADEGSIDQYFAYEGFRGIDWLDVADEIENAKTRNRDDAIARGILEKSRVQGEAILSGVLQRSGYDRVHVRFRSAEGKELQG
ncbi:MAG: DUF4230 domain-containing protein [Alkalispirochaeta sp.]